MYDNPTNLFQQKLKETISSNEIEVIKDLLRLHLFKNAEKDESLLLLVELYDLLGLEKFTSVIELINGKQIKFPKKIDFKDTIIQVLCYYYKNIEGKDWADIKDILKEENLRTIKIGIKNQQFDTFLSYLVERSKNGKQHDE